MGTAIQSVLVFALAALSALLVSYGSVLFGLGQWSRHWPAVPGVIESSTLRTARVWAGLHASWVQARYAWHAEQAHRGTWIGFACPGTASNPKFTPSAARALHAELIPGARVDVFVCPLWPAIAILRGGPDLAALGYVGLGLFLACLSLWISKP